MRAPKRRRPQDRRVIPPGTDVNLADIAERATYVGSPEHKDMPSFAGRPRPRSDATICDRQLTRNIDLVVQWLRTAIRRGATGGYWEGDFPRRVWHKDGEVVYEARLVNHVLGQYKGYPLTKKEWPKGLDSIYD